MNFPTEIDQAVRALMATRGGLGSIQRLDLPHRVADQAEKSLVFNEAGSPSLVVMTAPALFPHCVREAALRARSARARIDGLAGAAVLTALHLGDCDGRSFAVTRFLDPTRHGGIGGRWQRWRLRGAVLHWLRDVTLRTSTALAEGDSNTYFALPLEQLAAHPAVGLTVQAHARSALRDLGAGAWRPRWVLAHNDFWFGNLLHSPRDNPAAYPFAVIDWGGSSLQGHAMYDLVCMARSMSLPHAAFQAEIRAHSNMLECEPAYALHHLTAALAHLAGNLGQWPVERFAEVAAARIDFMAGTR